MSTTISESAIEAIKLIAAGPKHWDYNFIKDCYSLSFWSAVAIIILEFMTWDAKWKKKMEDQKIYDLYKQGILSTGFHFAVIGPAAYALSYWVILQQPSPFEWYISVPGVFLIQALGYASAHAWMHRPENYWIHKMHHQYNEKSFVRPLSANTVTVTEFTIAYALPIVTGLIIFRPSITDMWYVTMSISMFNLAIHTPSDKFSMNWAPSWMVTNNKHFRHHEKDVRVHYSAPIFDLDWILNIGQPGQYTKKA
eukprot:GSChrysophyteH1.ASY1.ANO1.3083.1 assembled CDS